MHRRDRVPNTESAERRTARQEREAIIAEQRAFLESFDRQVAELDRTACGRLVDRATLPTAKIIRNGKRKDRHRPK